MKNFEIINLKIVFYVSRNMFCIKYRRGLPEQNLKPDEHSIINQHPAVEEIETYYKQQYFLSATAAA